MSPSTKKVAAVHDLSCIGRCSLTVIIPILSSLGIQVCPLPTAVLSTHFGGFSNVAFCDFTDHILAFAAHWKREGLSFDCIYSGFLASERQIDVVSAFIDEFSENRPLILVDPVMGDEGQLYSVYTPVMQEQMKTLVRKADILTPNYTEACFLLGETYQATIPARAPMRNWLVRLADFGPSMVVITGIPAANNQIVNLGYDRRTEAYWEITSEHIPVRYPGTGDIFASILLGALLQGSSLPEAIQRAADFVAKAVQTTFAANTPPREGVLLEQALPWLGR